MIKKLPKVAIFVDVQNVFYTVNQAFNRNFDYNAFWTKVSDGREVECAFAYAIDRGDEKQKQFQNILRAIGFEVKLKPFIQRRDGSAKGDWDVGLAIDAMDWAEKVDRVVLVSGDGDFEVLVDRIQNKYQIPVDVFGVESLTANLLVKAASRFYPIDEKLLLNPRSSI
ncbi:NYN domain-containing protein [Aliikangiella sp. G2MR2-5]|uniref:NYN domain-containing protein n=1 Tax=Aliikangiella sp. G2MR2-5 TaxID=2788943 RepID=UPI001AEEF43E|nr:NYN domain-containing protein [Aliikangiella sp. G2MR2-5]